MHGIDSTLYLCMAAIWPVSCVAFMKGCNGCGVRRSSEEFFCYYASIPHLGVHTMTVVCCFEAFGCQL